MEPLAVVLIAIGAASIASGAFWFRGRRPAWMVWAKISAGSMLCGAGLLMQLGSTRVLNWVVVLIGLGVLGPLHFRFLLGPFEPPAPDSSATVVRS